MGLENVDFFLNQFKMLSITLEKFEPLEDFFREDAEFSRMYPRKFTPSAEKIPITRILYKPTLAELTSEEKMKEFCLRIKENFPWLESPTLVPAEEILKADIKEVYPLIDTLMRVWYVTHVAYHYLPPEEKLAVINSFIGNDEVLELGAKNAMTARAMRDFYPGVKWTATDLDPSQNPFFPVEKLSHLDSLKKYPNHKILALFWPSNDLSWPGEALKEFKGDRLIYCGEDQFGMTGDSAFFEELNQNWLLLEKIRIPRFFRLADSIKLYIRKTPVSDEVRK